ncbi:MAG TPA: T9SS type A sorting domain-containing protein [Ignavibacteria bacterium]|nr:T9SS type A sorting domain-containing protein [Ignavibacteria bacterium]
MNKLIITILIFFICLSININAEANNILNEAGKAGIGNTSGISDDYKLYQNFPNPFNPATIINYKINQSGFVTLNVYNLVGQVVKTLVNDYQEPGTYSRQFDASELSAGVYLYKLQVNNFTSVKRMTLIK